MADLNFCPFCGEAAFFVQTSYGTKDGSARLGFEIRCSECSATAPKAHGEVLVKLGANGILVAWKDDRQEAIEAWNRRVNDG